MLILILIRRVLRRVLRRGREVMVVASAAVPPQQITWFQPGVDPSTAQAAFVYTLLVTEEGNVSPRVVGLLNTLCGGTETQAECATALPAHGQAAIVTGNVSRLQALDTRTNQLSPLSAPFIGDQGCIFRDNLYAVGQRTAAQATKQGLDALYTEFQKAKFDLVSTTNLKGNLFNVIEECVGYLVPDRRK